MVAATLPFHYVPERLMVFPKGQLTFSKTFVTRTDIEYIIYRSENARNVLERDMVLTEPLAQKLLEMGLLVDFQGVLFYDLDTEKMPMMYKTDKKIEAIKKAIQEDEMK